MGLESLLCRLRGMGSCLSRPAFLYPGYVTSMDSDPSWRGASETGPLQMYMEWRRER